MNRKQLDHLREQKQYWWAALSTPVSYLAWLTSAACLIVLVARPRLVLAEVTIGVATVAVVAGIVKAVAVEALLNQLRDGRRPLRPHRHELRRTQIYRASRRDGFTAIGRAVGGVFLETGPP